MKLLRRKHFRLAMLAGAAIVCACLGVGDVLAQQARYVPIDPPKENRANTGKFAPLDWAPEKGDHPGKAKFLEVCTACHNLTDSQKVGPGLAGLADRVPERERLLKFITDPKSTDGDTYFKDQRAKFNEGMPAQGQPGGALTEQQILEIIDFIFRHKAETGPGPEERIKIGRALASGEKSFENGAPSCTGCHTIGAGMNSSHKGLRGANVGPNIAHTWVLARDAEALRVLMESPDGAAMHHFYAPNRKPLTGEEYGALIAFFERAARDTGTEHQANFLPIFALILAALGIFVLDGSLFGKLFVEEDHEYVDGPYADDHGHH
ncbi:MAG: c-type cytochrome [Planctomycetes bacterium]|nr:c-type cytochrome [Planctomycetota bacterium]